MEERTHPMTVEFAVSMTCDACAKSVRSVLDSADGIDSYTINVESEQVVVTSTKSVVELAQLLERTGMMVRVRGMGLEGGQNMGAAVVQLNHNGVMGVVRLVQLTEETLVLEGTIDGLSPGAHGIHIYEFGDLRDGGKYIGGHFNPTGAKHGGPDSEPGAKHVGDLGNILVNDQGRGVIRLELRDLKVWDIIGRSLAVTAYEDDLGTGKRSSSVDGNSGPILACAIIARSAGLFQNDKKICTCTGKTLWEENAMF